MVVLAAAFKSSETVCWLLPLQSIEEPTALSEKLDEQLSKVKASLSELEYTPVPAQELPFMHNTMAFAYTTLIISVQKPGQVCRGKGQAEKLYLAARCNGVLSCAS